MIIICGNGRLFKAMQQFPSSSEFVQFRRGTHRLFHTLSPGKNESTIRQLQWHEDGFG